MVSPRFYLSDEQKASLKRAVIKYTLPLLLVFLVALQQQVPLKDALVLVYGAALQLAINFLSKFLSETK
jgi:positive regulator of sigma E activity